jgi:ketosteroid isomerase-like protein
VSRDRGGAKPSTPYSTDNRTIADTTLKKWDQMTPPSAIRAVDDIEDGCFRAMVVGDIAVLDDLLPDDLHYVHANGIIEDKAEFIRKITARERLYRRFEATSHEARTEGGLTFVFGEADVEVDRTAGNLKNKLTYTAIYRNGASLQFMAWHAVKSAN